MVYSLSQQAEFFWSIGAIGIALLVWFNGAKAQKREREAKEREREAKKHECDVMLRFDELKELLAKQVKSKSAQCSGNAMVRKNPVLTSSNSSGIVQDILEGELPTD